MSISIEIDQDVALVLFELLADFYDQDALPVRDPSDRLALVRLSGALESTLVEPFQPNYKDLLEAARASLKTQFGDA